MDFVVCLLRSKAIIEGGLHSSNECVIGNREGFIQVIQLVYFTTVLDSNSKDVKFWESLRMN